jgi:tetratricopeptide (TPR) repeat protein
MAMKKILGLITISIVVALGTGFSPPQSGHDLFQKALVKERTEGNLQQAIELYQRIVRDFSNDRPLAAKALVQMGQCYEKLGKGEARKAYERVLRDYADQNEAAAQARTRLAALRKPVVKESGMVTRQVWTGPGADIEGAPSPDGKFLSFVDWDTGDLAIRDLETGTNRRLTNKGPWEKSEEYAEFSRWSPDGKLIAYDWYDGK